MRAPDEPRARPGVVLPSAPVMTPTTPTTAALSPRATSWNRGLAASPGRLDLEIPAARVDGRIPPELHGGRLLSNGPGWSVIGGVTAHPFDGHGYVRALAFRRDGSVRLRARFVETPSYRDEAAAGRLVDRGLATNLPGPFWRNLGLGRRPRNVANTTILRWGERLLAGWEGGAPYALDPATLATLGEETFGGAIAGVATLAHMKYEAASGRLILCSVEMGPPMRLTFREVDRSGRVVAAHQAELPGRRFVHDFALTPHWYVLGGNPIRLHPPRLAGALLGASTLLRAIATDPDAPPCLHLIPRGGGPARTLRLPAPGWVVHFGGAFERDGAVVVDACVLPRFEFGEEFGYAGPAAPFDPTRPEARGPQRLYRITAAEGAAEATWEPLCGYGVDFPRVHPEHEGRPTPALFGATRADPRYSDPFDSVIRVDLVDRERPPTLWTAPADTFVGEPIFVPRPGEPDAGHVLALVTRGLDQRTDLVVLDARALDRGPVARVPLPLLPVAFHGDWDGAPDLADA